MDVADAEVIVVVLVVEVVELSWVEVGELDHELEPRGDAEAALDADEAGESA
jgi:hypothetical protein